MWRPVSALLQDELEVLALDLLGHGRNAPARTGSRCATSPTTSPPCCRLARTWSAPRTLVAQHLARHRSELVASLTSVSSVCRRTERERTAVLERLAAAEADFPASVEASLQRWYADTGTDPELVRETEATLLANDVTSYLNCYRVFATADAEIGPELPRITTPALAITGELDLVDARDDPPAGHGDAGLPGRCRAERPALLPVQRPQELVTPLTTLIRERGNVASRTV